jgi:hypothetical protein
MKNKHFVVGILAFILVLGMTVIGCDDGSKGGGGGGITIDGWTYIPFNDKDNGGTSTYAISNNNGAITLSGNVTTVYEFGYVGLMVIPNAEMLESLKTASSISFKVKGDGNSAYRIQVATSDITDYSYWYTTFTPSSIETTQTIYPSYTLFRPTWGQDQTILFDKSKAQFIQFQTPEGESGQFSITISDLTLQ